MTRKDLVWFRIIVGFTKYQQWIDFEGKKEKYGVWRIVGVGAT